jgi:hypothetical protein
MKDISRRNIIPINTVVDIGIYQWLIDTKGKMSMSEFIRWCIGIAIDAVNEEREKQAEYERIEQMEKDGSKVVKISKPKKEDKKK